MRMFKGILSHDGMLRGANTQFEYFEDMLGYDNCTLDGLEVCSCLWSTSITCAPWRRGNADYSRGVWRMLFVFVTN